MIYWVLPPKRFEDISHPKFDAIRPRAWFQNLMRRRPRFGDLKIGVDLIQRGESFTDAAKAVEIDKVDLIDYFYFIQGISPKQHPAFVPILNRAYEMYCEGRASKNINHYLTKEAPLWGLKPRRVMRNWAIDPTYYPDGYPIL